MTTNTNQFSCIEIGIKLKPQCSVSCDLSAKVKSVRNVYKYTSPLPSCQITNTPERKNQTFISTNQTFLCALRPFTASLNIPAFYLAIIFSEQQGILFNVASIFLQEINEMFLLISKNLVNQLVLPYLLYDKVILLLMKRRESKYLQKHKINYILFQLYVICTYVPPL